MASKEEEKLVRANQFLRDVIDVKYVHIKKKWRELHDVELDLAMINSRKAKDAGVEAYHSELKFERRNA